EFGIERNARSIRDCNYCFHETTNRTEASLIDDGYDPEQIKGLPTYTLAQTVENLSRDTVEESRGTGGDVNQSARQLKITEHYIRIDYEGNGKTALYRITTGGEQGEILRRDMSEDDEKTAY